MRIVAATLFFVWNSEPDDKPGYVLNDHLSNSAVTDRLQRPTWKQSGPDYRFRFGLASSGVYMASSVTRRSVGSYPAFPPLLEQPAVYFCCTILRVTSTGRYPAPCPAKPGLSSPSTFRCLRQRSFIRLWIFPILTNPILKVNSGILR